MNSAEKLLIRQRNFSLLHKGWSGGAMVLDKLPVPGRPTCFEYSRARTYCAWSRSGGGGLDIFSLDYHFSLLSPSLWETVRYRLKYCLKGPLSPKQPTNSVSHTRLLSITHRLKGQNNCQQPACPWMDGWLAILRPFQQYFSHIRQMRGWSWKVVCNGIPFMIEKISPRAGIKLGLLD